MPLMEIIIGNLGKIFLSFRNDLYFISNCDLQWYVTTVFMLFLTVSEQE